MKKLFVLALLISFVLGMGAVHAGRAAAPGIGEIFGQGKLDSDPGKVFRFVRFTDYTGGYINTQVSPDSIVVWDTTADDGVSVTYSSTYCDSAIAGVIATTTDAPTTTTTASIIAASEQGKSNWGFLQTYGLCNVWMDNDTTPAAVGSALAIGRKKGRAGAFLPSTTASTQNGNGGVFLDQGHGTQDGVEAILHLD